MWLKHHMKSTMAPVARWVSPKLVESGSARTVIKLDTQLELMLKMVEKSKLILLLLVVMLMLNSKLEMMMLVQALESWENASPLCLHLKD